MIREFFNRLSELLHAIPIGGIVEGNKLPIGDAASWMVEYIKGFPGLLSSIRGFILFFYQLFESFFLFFPPWMLILALAALAYWSGKKIGLAILTFVGLLLIWNLGYWTNTVYTLSLVLTSAIAAIIVGIPLGIWAATSSTVNRITAPVLDFMQTMPAFVYLIPVVTFFSIGEVPGIIASFIFAMPPTVRLTTLGIKQVPTEMVEASDAFGTTSAQKLFKVQLPLAKKTMMAGINQTIMLALSMVVIASMVGAKGLGRDIYFAVSQINVKEGVEAGLCIVILAILLDRITQNFGDQSKIRM
jgi:glycine betaine/proline transport system permease protein